MADLNFGKRLSGEKVHPPYKPYTTGNASQVIFGSTHMSWSPKGVRQ